MQIRSTLRELGLTEGEIKTYLGLLELGSSTVGPIVEKSGISSSKAYILLEKLIQKGLVSYTVREKTKYFQADPPTSLFDYLEKKQVKMKQIEGELKKAVEELEAKQNNQNVPEEARIYKGYKGLKTAWTRAISSIPDKGKYYFFSIGYGEDPYLQQFFRNIVEELKKRKITIHGIANVSEKGLYKGYYEKYGYRMKYTKLMLPADTTIAGDYVLILVWDKKEPIVHMIKSGSLVKSYTKFMKSL